MGSGVRGVYICRGLCFCARLDKASGSQEVEDQTGSVLEEEGSCLRTGSSTKGER